MGLCARVCPACGNAALLAATMYILWRVSNRVCKMCVTPSPSRSPPRRPRRPPCGRSLQLPDAYQRHVRLTCITWYSTPQLQPVDLNSLMENVCGKWKVPALVWRQSGKQLRGRASGVLPRS
eukprot:364436-Chlamydomonas_euryale.AAC.3